MEIIGRGLKMLILTSACEFEFHQIDHSSSQSIVSALWHTSQQVNDFTVLRTVPTNTEVFLGGL